VTVTGDIAVMTDTAPISRRLAVDGPLSNALVDRIQAIVTAAAPETREFSIDAAGVTEIDPVAAARLWLFCDRSDAARRRRMRIVGLSAQLLRSLSRHPLRAFVSCDEALFDDPFASLAPSTR
jgi:hypothetical protein